MKQLRHLPRNAIKYMLIALSVYGALVAFGLLFLQSEGLSWQTWETFSTPQKLLAALVAAPGAGLVYLLAAAMAEAIFAVLCVATFKIVTLGQIGIGIDAGAPFNALGIGRDSDGKPVASEGLIVCTTVVTWLCVGLAAYRWWPS